MGLSLDCDAETVFIRMVKARLRVDFVFYCAVIRVSVVGIVFFYFVIIVTSK